MGGKGASGMGGAAGIGILRCAQDDGKNKQPQKQTTAKNQSKTDNGESQNKGNGRSRSPSGMTTKKSNSNCEYRGLSAARRTMMPSAASVEMAWS
jgi:hypothetical protein